MSKNINISKIFISTDTYLFSKTKSNPISKINFPFQECKSKNIISENNFLLLLIIFKSSETFILKYHIISKYQKYQKQFHIKGLHVIQILGFPILY